MAKADGIKWNCHKMFFFFFFFMLVTLFSEGIFITLALPIGDEFRSVKNLLPVFLFTFLFLAVLGLCHCVGCL